RLPHSGGGVLSRLLRDLCGPLLRLGADGLGLLRAVLRRELTIPLIWLFPGRGGFLTSGKDLLDLPDRGVLRHDRAPYLSSVSLGRLPKLNRGAGASPSLAR